MGRKSIVALEKIFIWAASGKTDGWLHVLHRVKDGLDVFFVTNQNLDRVARPFKFRVTANGEPECWDAMRNEIARVDYRRLGPDQVEISLTLEPSESVLLVFHPDQRSLPPRLAPGTRPVREFQVEREPNDGALKSSAREPSWWDWLERKGKLTRSPVTADPFNGQVKLSADLDLTRTRVYLECDDISPEAAARITINGQDAGGFISRPLRLPVTAFLKPGINTIRIEPFSPKKVTLAVY